MTIEGVAGADVLLADVLRLAIDYLRTEAPTSQRFHSAATFLDEAGLLAAVCRIRALDYERCIDSLISGPLDRRQVRRG